jgi:hypothetical protein
MKRSSHLQSLPYLVVANTVDVTNISTFQSIKPTGLDTWHLQADPGMTLSLHLIVHYRLSYAIAQ